MVIALITFMILDFVALINAAKNTRKLSRSVTHFLASLLLPEAAMLLILLSRNRLLSQIAFYLYMAGSVWMRYFFVRFTYTFWAVRFRDSRMRIFLLSLIGLDAVLMLLNIKYGIVFGVTYARHYPIAYHLIPHKLFFIHHAVLQVMLFVAFALYLQKLLVISRLYAEKYLVPFMGMLVIISVEAAIVIRHDHIDLAMFAYAGYGLLAYLYALVHIPLLLTDRMLSKAVATISDAIIFLDTHGECIYLNRAAGQLLGVSRTDYARAQEKLIDFINAEEQLSSDETKKTKTITQNFVEYNYEIEFHRIYDSAGRYSGAFISIQDRSEEVRQLQRETYAATHDSLTGLYNRDYLCRLIEQRLKEQPYDDFLILCSDILEFKLVNDIFGKEAGDQILINTARIMDSLASPSTLYGRIGGDRFALMLPKEEFDEETFINSAGEFSLINGEVFYPATVQFGVYEVIDHTIPASIMFDRAFMAIESIKHDIQTRLAYYTDEMRDILLWEQQLTTQLDDAMRDNLIMPYLQPQVDTDGRVEGAEVLCRWDHTPQGIMVPENFIGILERNGMIVKLDCFMWESACRILKDWTSRGKGNFYLSVNISPKDFYYIDVYKTITSLVEKYDIEPERLRLEITETVMMTDSALKFEIIDRLRDRGFVVEMDDFGSGYSSLNMLKDLPVDIIKFDMLFLSHTEHSERARTILQHMFAMANQLEIPVITEGVETQEQADFLAELGCNMFQGFFFSRPVTLEAFEKTYF